MPLSVPSELTANVGDLLAAANWNSNVRDGINFLLNQPSFSVHLATAQSIPNAAVTTVKWDTVDEDNYSGYNAGSGVYTVPAGMGGRWLFSSAFMWAGNASGVRATQMFAGGNSIWSWIAAATDSDGRNSVFWLGRLAAGAQVVLNAYQTSGAALNTATLAANVSFSGQRLGN